MNRKKDRTRTVAATKAPTHVHTGNI